jgi:hypothetical protein
LHRGEALFDVAGSFIDGSGDTADLVLRSFADAGVQITLGNASSDLDDMFEAASAPLGSSRGDY